VPQKRGKAKSSNPSTIPPSKKKWIAIYYKDGSGRAPARDSLRAADFPKNVRLAVEARAKAVRDAPPAPFPGGSPVWSPMTRDREKGRVDMSGIFEIRDKQRDTLYRLFCVWTATRSRTAWRLPRW
jgi:hypothetical protein